MNADSDTSPGLRALFLGWLGVACLAAAWLLAVDFYGDTGPKPAELPVPGVAMPIGCAPDVAEPWVWIALAGCLLMSLVPLRVPAPRDAAVAAVLVLPATLMAWPEKLGPALLLFGFTILACVQWVPRLRGVGRVALISGTVWIAQGIAMAGYAAFTARSPVVPRFLMDGLAWIARLTGVDAAVDGGNIVLFAMREKQPLAATWTLLVDPVSVCFFAGAIVLVLLASARRRVPPLVTLSLVMVVWLVARVTLLMSVYLNTILRTEYGHQLLHAGQFWNRWVHIGMIVPAVLIAWRFVRVVPAFTGPVVLGTATAEDRGTPVWRRAIPAAMVFAAVVLLAMAVVWKPSGKRKEGRILIDEGHCFAHMQDAKGEWFLEGWSGWRWPHKNNDTTSTLRPYDRQWHAHEAAYNYASLYEYLSRLYDIERYPKLKFFQNRQRGTRLDPPPITDEVLRTCDVLVLKVASRYYEKAEIDAVEQFVKRGGGLLILGEHTSVFGSGVCLNQVARRFGFEFRSDCLFGIDSVFVQRYHPPMVPHPVVGRMGPLDFAISCSIDPGLSSGCAVIRGDGLKSLGADYNKTNSYPTPDDRPEMLHGSFVQLWATTAGEGRVLGYSDSTMFANFSIFERGKSELFLGMMMWLNHEQGVPTWWLVALGFLLLLGAGVLCRGGQVVWSVLLGAGVAGWVTALSVAPVMHTLPLPKLQRPMVQVSFDRSLCTKTRYPVGGFLSGQIDEFGLFERTVQRLTERIGPKVDGKTWTSYRVRAGESAMALNADLATYIHPCEPVSAELREQMIEFVQSGGRLLVMDSSLNDSSTANEILQPFGVTMVRSKELEGEAKTTAGLPALPLKEAYAVTGGTPFVWIGDTPVATRVRRGKGSLVVIGFASRFSDQNMGVSGDVDPSEEVLKVFDFEFALLPAIVDDKLR